MFTINKIPHACQFLKILYIDENKIKIGLLPKADIVHTM